MSTAAQVLDALKPYGLKQNHDGQYRCNSPFRPGSDSHAFVVTLQDEERGAFYDHASDEKGSLYELAQRLGIVPDRTPIEDSKRAYANLDDYAQAHGIPGDVLRQANWREVSHDGRPALEFSTKTGKRYRFLDGQKPVYKSTPGYKRCWYGLNQVLFEALQRGSPLVICNGEISVVTAQRYGLAACAVTSGEKAIPPNLIDELRTDMTQVNEVLVALDCDETGNRAARQIISQMQAAGFSARAIDLKLGKGGDLADFCRLHAPNVIDALRKLPSLRAETQSTATRQRWRIISASELATLPPITWHIDREIPTQGLIAIYGPSGAGKTFLALDYACRVKTRVPVMYIAAEGQSGYEQRLQAWLSFHRQTRDNLHFCLGAVSLIDQSDADRFISELQRLNVGLVVVDTLARCMVGGDENSTRDMSLLIDSCDRMRQAISGSVVVVHHVGKSGLAERGSSVLRASCDVMISVTNEDDTILIECSKTKDDEPFPTRAMRLLPVKLAEGKESRVLVPTTQVLPEPNARLSPQRRKLLDALTLADFERGATSNDLAGHTGIAPSITRKTLNSLYNLKLVERRQLDESKAYVYVLSDGGHAALRACDPDHVPSDPSLRSTMETNVIHVIHPFSDSLKTSLQRLEKGPDQVDQMDHLDHLDHMVRAQQPDLGLPEVPDYFRAGL